MNSQPMTLTEALEGLTEERFCTGALARDKWGRQVEFESNSAATFCVNGWFSRHRVGSRAPAVIDMALRCAKSLGYANKLQANDALGYKFVEALRKYQEAPQ